MKSEPVFSVVRRSDSDGCSRSLAAVAALGIEAAPFAFSEAWAWTACGAAMVAPPAATIPLRNRRRWSAAFSGSAIGILRFFHGAFYDSARCFLFSIIRRLPHRKPRGEMIARQRSAIIGRSRSNDEDCGR